MTYINILKEIEIEIPNLGYPGGGMDGEFKLEAFKGVEFPRGSGKYFEIAGTNRLLQDWSSNLITNQGLDFYGQDTGNCLNYCHVGTDNTPPANDDTKLKAFVASQIYESTPTITAESVAPYYGMEQNIYIFQPDFAGTGIPVNLNEIGVSSTAADGNITARSLTVNGSGTPTTLVVQEDEYLRAYYRRRNYPGHIVEATGAPTDDTGVVTVEGVAYTYTIRPAMVTVAGTHSTGTGNGWGTGTRYTLHPDNGYNVSTSAKGLAYVYDAALGLVTGSPTGGTTPGLASPSVTSSGSYTATTYQRELMWQWQIDSGNTTNGIGALLLKTSMGAYQLLFTSPAYIPKVYGQVLTFYHNFSWNRKNPPWL